VRERWSPYFSTFKGSAPPVEIKTQIREIVFRGLSDPTRKIRTLCAHTLSVIAKSDWPDEYPNLLTSLIALLSSNSSDSVHGAIQVLTEFIKSDLTEDQILPVLRDLLPVLLSILGSPQVCNLLRIWYFPFISNSLTTPPPVPVLFLFSNNVSQHSSW
jgi:importin-9